nr:30S ribosomal protein S9 [Cytobacillus kochii]
MYTSFIREEIIEYRCDMKERKKYGLKGARRAPQFSKR